ncbi:ABC transporter permease [Clostridium sp.]|uniref:ABC transporter permease n=1 Tax=Clostridium sp. TaxID=1506 RepID=UPI003F2EA4B1
MRHKKHIVNIIILCLMIVCLGFSIGYANKSKEGKHIANIYSNNKSLTAYEINNMHKSEEIEKKKLSFTGWKQIDDVEIEYTNLNRTTNVDVIKVCGDSSLLIKGPILFLDNKEGCLIDQETAYELFGSTDVVGQVLKYDNREVKIIGIHSGMNNTIVMQTDYDSKEIMDAIAIEVDGNVSKSIKEFSNRYSIDNFGVDSKIYYNIANIFIMILPFIIAILLLVKCIKEISLVKRKPFLFIIYIAFTVAIFAILIKITGIEIKIPYDLIPNKWSDFGYWEGLFKEYTEKFETILYMKKYNIDIINIQSATKSIMFSILSIILFLNFRNRIKINNIKQGAIIISVMLSVSFIVIIGLEYKYGLDINGLMIWFIYPYYYISMYISSGRLNSLIE